jgi:hypothetical protein
MAFTVQALADGQLADAKGTLYTTPGSTQTIIKSITLVNTDGSAQTVNLYAKPGATSRRIIPKDMSLAAGAQFTLDCVLTLEAGDLIEGDAATANVVDFVISGVENA